MAIWGKIGKVASTFLGNTASTLLGLGGSALSGAINYKQAKELQQRNFDFQERMSNTAYQRATTDMRAAGLNPILAATNQTAASTPSGGMGTINTPDYGANILNGIASAQQIKKNNADINLINSQAKTEEVKALNFQADTALKHLQGINQHIENTFAPSRLKEELQKVISERALNLSLASAKQAEIEIQRFNAETGRMDAKTNRMNAESNKSNSISNENTSNANVKGIIGGLTLGALSLAIPELRALKFLKKPKIGF